MRYEHPQAARWSKVSALTSDDGPRPLLLGPIVSFLSANWLGLALWAVIGLSLTATYVMRAEPTYRSRAVIILDYRLPGSDGRVPSDSADSAYIDTQIKIIESNDVLLKVVDELALDKDPEFVSVKSGVSSKLAAWRSSLEQMIFAARMPPQDTTSSAEAIPADELRQIAARQLWSAMRASRAGRSYVAEIEVTANSSEKSARIANAIARTYVDYQWKFRMAATERESAPLARILTPASPLVERTGMKTPVLLALGLFAGLGFGICIAAARLAMKRTVGGRSDLEDELAIRCLGLVPSVRALRPNPFSQLLPRWLRASSRKPLSSSALSYAADFPTSLFCEALRLLRSQLVVAASGHRAIVVGVVSACGSEGRSTLIANFAQLLARAGEKVLLVDADFQTRQLTETFASLTFLSSDGADADAEISEVRCFPGIALKFAPLLGPAVDEKFMSRQDWVGRIIATHRKEFDWICVDMPALARCGDALAIVNFLDHLVILAEWNKTDRSALGLTLKMLEPQRPKVLGVVLNKVARRKMTLME
ncbi:lipopolysaccharide biosynthesis protein (plasmid) [Rhizobium gallicum]|uniref:Lipopolysaccharide biosynthesis protein n=2 Tax=Rhizobium gallicum TaxID=56730 RepID=A0A1L5NY35_9HYPH|nr:lipopolysaccharide biosynthesis protein [Rhizobium gallicum]